MGSPGAHFGSKLGSTKGLSYDEFKMHAMNLRVQALRSTLARAEPCYWSEGHHNNVGVSMRARRATRQDGTQL